MPGYTPSVSVQIRFHDRRIERPVGLGSGFCGLRFWQIGLWSVRNILIFRNPLKYDRMHWQPGSRLAIPIMVPDQMAEIMKKVLQFIVIGSFLANCCAAQSSRTVVIGGTGPTPHLQTMIDGISDMLGSAGIDVKVNSGEAKSRTVILEEMRASGYSNLLFISLYQSENYKGKVIAESFIDGKKIWQEEAGGSSFSMVSPEKEVAGMLKRINEKLKKQIGKPGLPK
jgi:hypothetical protein